MEKIFKALGDKTRRELLLIISNHSQICLCELESAFNLSTSNLSRHLKELEGAKLLSSEKVGKWKHYKISDLGSKSVEFICSVDSENINLEIIKKLGGIQC